MRLSIHKGDAGYRPPAICRKAVVTLDGVPVEHCFTADEGLGEVRCYVYPYRIDTTGEHLEEVVRRGHVVIKFREE